MRFTLHYLIHRSPGEQSFPDLREAANYAFYCQEENIAFPVKITEGEDVIWLTEFDGGIPIEDFIEKLKSKALIQ